MGTFTKICLEGLLWCFLLKNRPSVSQTREAMHVNNVKNKIAAKTSEWSEIERRFWNERKTKRRFNYPPWPSHGTPPPIPQRQMFSSVL